MWYFYACVRWRGMASTARLLTETKKKSLQSISFCHKLRIFRQTRVQFFINTSRTVQFPILVAEIFAFENTATF